MIQNTFSLVTRPCGMPYSPMMYKFLIDKGLIIDEDFVRAIYYPLSYINRIQQHECHAFFAVEYGETVKHFLNSGLEVPDNMSNKVSLAYFYFKLVLWIYLTDDSVDRGSILE